MDPVNLSLKVPAIEKLIDYGASGVGSIAGPLLAPWRASREGRARLIAAEADAGVRQIQAGADASALNIIAKAQSHAQSYMPLESDVHGTLDITREGIAQSMEFQGRKRLVNARAVLEGAADELGDEKVGDHDPDPDWTARFFDCVQDVSSEDMQKLWSKVLAGEVESPGRTSLRTLNTLQNMTQRDAVVFKDIGKFVFDDQFIFYHEQVKAIEELAMGKLLHLQDCGLMVADRILSQTLQFDGEPEVSYRFQGSILLVVNKGEPVREVQLPTFRLTASGRELVSLLSPEFFFPYLQGFAGFLESNQCELYYLQNAILSTDGRIDFDSKIRIRPAT